MSRIASALVGLAMLCPVDLDAGVPEAGMPTANVRHVLTETQKTAEEIQAVIKLIRELYGVNK